MRRYSNYSGYRSSYKPRSVRKIENKARKKIFFTAFFSISLIIFLAFWGLPWMIGSLSIFSKSKITNTNAGLEDSAIAPPVLNIPFDATNSATLTITGYSNPDSQVEIYFDDELKDTVITGSNGSFSSNDLELAIGTNNIYGKTVNNKGNKSLASKTIRLSYNNEKPQLEISSPQDNQEIKGGDKKINVSGKTQGAISASINGSTVIIDNNGAFAQDIPLNDGENIITITAQNSVGNTTKIQKRVIYSP